MEEPDLNSSRLTDVSALSGDVENTLEEAEARLGGFLKMMNAKTCNDVTSGKIHNKFNKPDMAAELFHMAKQLESCVKILSNHRERTMEFQSVVIQCQQDKIVLQDKLIKSQEKNTVEIQSVMKTEVKSWSDALKRNMTKQIPRASNNITSKQIENAVKKVVTEEDRSKNLIIYGVEEIEGEEAHVVVDAVLDIVEVPKNVKFSDVRRLGVPRSGQHRPMIVTMDTSEAVTNALRKSGKLKLSEKHSKTYIDSDRLAPERAERKKLVVELKKKIASNPNQFHCIRHNQIMSLKRTENTA